ncbi:MAG: type II toxin-antitoxin system RelE/ParE family toxin [Alphaproteobacteria bacterium]|nr:type II toxin-antitoxin system RelE/ParE family toxin [Alphaproteobacteria bacterium]
MIRSFKCSETQKIWEGKVSKKLHFDIQQVARRKLRMLNNAHILNDLRIPPANRLEPLRGNRVNQWSIRINNQWRVCFYWHDGDVSDVEIVDYY